MSTSFFDLSTVANNNTIQTIRSIFRSLSASQSRDKPSEEELGSTPTSRANDQESRKTGGGHTREETSEQNSAHGEESEGDPAQEKSESEKSAEQDSAHGEESEGDFSQEENRMPTPPTPLSPGLRFDPAPQDSPAAIARVSVIREQLMEESPKSETDSESSEEEPESSETNAKGPRDTPLIQCFNDTLDYSYDQRIYAQRTFVGNALRVLENLSMERLSKTQERLVQAYKKFLLDKQKNIENKWRIMDAEIKQGLMKHMKIEVVFSVEKFLKSKDPPPASTTIENRNAERDCHVIKIDSIPSLKTLSGKERFEARLELMIQIYQFLERREKTVYDACLSHGDDVGEYLHFDAFKKMMRHYKFQAENQLYLLSGYRSVSVDVLPKKNIVVELDCETFVNDYFCGDTIDSGALNQLCQEELQYELEFSTTETGGDAAQGSGENAAQGSGENAAQGSGGNAAQGSGGNAPPKKMGEEMSSSAEESESSDESGSDSSREDDEQSEKNNGNTSSDAESLPPVKKHKTDQRNVIKPPSFSKAKAAVLTAIGTKKDNVRSSESSRPLRRSAVVAKERTANYFRGLHGQE